MPNHTPLISIVTIVYNDIAHIAQTMNSVVMQSYENLEYIIIDGNSNDGTKERIVGYIKDCAEVTLEESSATESSSRFYIEATHKAKRNFTFKFLSEQDSGIYDAMNKGINLATGQWCNFMNCGDRFYANNTIEELFGKFFERQGEIISLNHADQACGLDNLIVYGDTQICYDESHSKILRTKPITHKYQHIGHQSAFIATPLLRSHPYDTSFKIAGDVNFFTTCFRHGSKFIYIDIVVCTFDANGISSKPNWRMLVEEVRIVSRGNRFYAPLYAFFRSLRYLAKYLITTLLPRNLSLKIASLYNAKS